MNFEGIERARPPGIHIWLLLHKLRCDQVFDARSRSGFEESCSAATVSSFLKTFGHPSLMFLKAVSFFGAMKPEWTRRRHVPFSTLERTHVTTVSSREPYPTFPSCPPFQA
jgi:hypothetical protein